MNSFDYLEVSVKLNPFTEEMAEILTAELSELPFDSFVTEEPYLKCYIQTTEYKASDVKVVLSGYPAVEGFTATPVQASKRTLKKRPGIAPRPSQKFIKKVERSPFRPDRRRS